MPEKLTMQESAAATTELEGWTLEQDTLTWKRTFPSFPAAFAFATQIALLAERRDHHPSLTIDYRDLTLRLTTHDAGGVTARDVDFARAVLEVP